jgi:hypothetical protein
MMMRRGVWLWALLVAGALGCSETGEPGSGGTGGTGGQGGNGGSDGSTFPCTEAGIRAAVAAGGGPNTFLCDGPTTVVTAGHIQIDDDVILDGEGELTIDGAGDHRVFIIGEPAVGPDPPTVELHNMTITGGFAELPEVGGGGILSGGELTIVGCTITKNQGPESGIASFGELTIEASTISDNEGYWAINHRGTAMTISDSTISGNAGGGLSFSGQSGYVFGTTISDNVAGAGLGGGGIKNLGDLWVHGSVITGNRAERGGGVWNAGDLSLGRVTIAGNTAVEGGGIYNADPHNPDGPVSRVGLLSLYASTVSANVAERGGGIYMAGLWHRITNSTVSGNTAETGGGIAMAGTLEGPSSLPLANTTMTANAAEEGGAIWATGESPELRFVGTIVEGACAEGPGTVAWVSHGSNIESPGDTCRFTDANDQVSVASDALKLEPLADNGGFTESHAPAPGSAAIDAMLAEDCSLSLPEPLQDQRFVNRPVGAACDIGSVEVE